MNNYNRNRNNNGWTNNNQHGGGGDRRRGNARGVRNFTKFVDMEHGNNEQGYWPQNDWNYYNQHNNSNNFHDNNHYTNGGGGGGGIFPWQRQNPVNSLIIPPLVSNILPIVNDPTPNKEVDVQNNRTESTVPQNIQKPSTQGKQNENQNAEKSSTPKRRKRPKPANENTDNITPVAKNVDSNPAAASKSEPAVDTNFTVKIKQEKQDMIKRNQEKTTPKTMNRPKLANENTDNITPFAKNVDSNPAPSSKSEPVVDTNFTVKIKQEKRDMIKLKQERKSSSSSSSSSEDSSSEEETESIKKPTAPNTTMKPAKATAPSTGVNSLLNIKLKPQEGPAAKANSTNLSHKPNSTKKVPEPSSSSSSSSSSENEQPPLKLPPLKLASKQVTKSKAPPVQKQEEKVKPVKNSSEDDVVCMGQLENKIVLEDDEEEDSDDENDLEEPTKSKKTNKRSKKVNKTEKCMICDKKGHTSFQCQMICKNCSAPYHGFRTCPHPANLNIMLQLFMEFCMQQIQHYNSEKQFASQIITSSKSIDSFPKPQVASPSTSNLIKANNKKKRKQVKTKPKPTKKRKLSNSKKILSEDDEEEVATDSTSQEESTDSEDSSSSSESLVSASTKKKLKNPKTKNNSMAAFNLANFIPNSGNLPMVLNGFPNLTATPANVATNPNTPSNALNTLLLTQMFQNAIGSLK